MALAMLAGAEIAKLDWPYDAPAPVPCIIRTAIKLFGAVKIRYKSAKSLTETTVCVEGESLAVGIRVEVRSSPGHAPPWHGVLGIAISCQYVVTYLAWFSKESSTSCSLI